LLDLGSSGSDKQHNAFDRNQHREHDEKYGQFIMFTIIVLDRT